MGGSAPKPTDPKKTSAAQTGTSVTTGVANAWMQNMNEIGPDGTRTFDQIGEQQVFDPYTKKTYTIPRFQVTTSLNDKQQFIKDENDRASQNLATLGANLSGQLGDKLTGNFTIGNEAVEGRLWDLASKRLNPRFADDEESLRTRLANQGIKAGSDAYNKEMARFDQGKNDAFNQVLLQGRGQAVQEQLAEDNQRINQIGALLSGGQVSQPNFATSLGITAMPTTDNASIIANNDAQKMQAWQTNQAMMGQALGSLGSMFALSDENAKEDMRKIGETEDGLGIFSYRMKGSPKTEIGLKAQDVQKKKPRAVKRRADGLLAVNYAEALG